MVAGKNGAMVRVICSVLVLLISACFPTTGMQNAAGESWQHRSGTLLPIWSRTWGGTSWDEAYSVAVNGSFIYVAGQTYSYSAGSYDVFVLKYDTNGNLLWNRTWGGTNYDLAYSIAVNATSVYVCGRTESYGAGYVDAFVLKYDVSGNLIWNRTWGGVENDYASSIAIANSSIYVTGWTYSFGEGQADAFMLKYDPGGNLIWNRTWGGAGLDMAHSIAVSGSSIFLAGQTDSYGSGGFDAFILKCDMSGNMLWNMTWGGSNKDYANAMAVSGSSVYAAGMTESYGSGAEDSFVLECDVDGSQLWNRTWGDGGSDESRSIAVNSQGVYAAGYSETSGPGHMDALVLKYNESGGLQWSKTWGGGNTEAAASVAVNATSMFISGYTNSYGSGLTDAFTMKCDLLGGNNPPNAFIDSITPNPVVIGQAATFTGHGIDVDGSVVACNWTSSIDGKLNDSASFTSSTLSLGMHTITFSVKDNEGLWGQEAVGTLAVIPPNKPPTAYIDAITPNPATQGQAVVFTGHGTDSDGIVTGFNWTSSLDGNLGTTPVFTTATLSIGTHTVTFSVKDNNNSWSQEVVQTLVVNPSNQPPIAVIDSISPTSATQGQAVTFTGHGADSDGTIVSYKWTSNIDGKLNESATFTTSSLSVGTHNIKFSVMDNNSTWSSEAEQTLVVSPPNKAPVAVIDSISPKSAVQGQMITFRGHGIDSDGTIVGYSWISSIDGNLSISTYFSTSSLSLGTHLIKFKVRDNNGTWSQEVVSNLTITKNNTIPNNGNVTRKDANLWLAVIIGSLVGAIIVVLVILTRLKSRRAREARAEGKGGKEAPRTEKARDEPHQGKQKRPKSGARQELGRKRGKE